MSKKETEAFFAELNKKLTQLKSKTSWTNIQAALLVEEIDALYWKFPSKDKFGQEFLDSGAPALWIKILNQFETDGLFKVDGAWETAYCMYNALCNLTESSSALSVDLGEKGMVKLCTHNIVKYRNTMHVKDVEGLIRISLSIVCNMSTAPANRHLFREEKVAEKMEPYLNGDDPFLKTICMITLAYIVEEGEEESLVLKGADAIEYLVGILKDALKRPDKRYRGLCDREIAQALGRLAVHDCNKARIMEAGGLDPLLKMLEDKSPDTQEAAANTLWNLSFSEPVREKLADTKACVETLKKLATCTESHVSDAAKGALWVITRGSTMQENDAMADDPQALAEASEMSEESQKHIMISYQWGCQSMVLKIRDMLQQAGYQVWVDVDQMHGSTLQAMAEAVEHSCVVLMCLSERYKESPNCRTEAEYAFQLRKPIVPVMMEEYYRPDGWLGLILGSKFYLDFSGKLDQEVEMGKLLKEVETLAKSAKVTAGGGGGGGAGDGAKSAGHDVARHTSRSNSRHKVLDWSNDAVKNWLKETGLESWRPSLLKFDGNMLLKLCKLRREAPEFFYKSSQDDHALEKLTNVFQFTEALDALMNE